MSDINKWFATGVMASDPEMKETAGGKPYCRFRYAYTRGWGDNQESSFVTCQVYGKSAEYVFNNGGKGKRATLEGELVVIDKQKEDGWHTSVFITVRELKFMGSNGNSKSSEGSTYTNSAKKAIPTESYDGILSSDDDGEDIPF